MVVQKEKLLDTMNKSSCFAIEAPAYFVMYLRVCCFFTFVADDIKNMIIQCGIAEADTSPLSFL